MDVSGGASGGKNLWICNEGPGEQGTPVVLSTSSVPVELDLETDDPPWWSLLGEQPKDKEEIVKNV